MILSPERQPNRITKVEVKNKKMNKEFLARTTDDSSTKDDGQHFSPAIAKPNVVRSPLSVRDLRVGNYLMKDGVMVKIDARSIFDIWEETKEYEPVLLTEEIMVRFRRNIKDDFQPIEFDKRPPGERQNENNFWSSWIDEDYKLHLSPSYNTDWIDGKPVKSNEANFWFCWYSGSAWFLSVKHIRGKNRLQFVHQLQNLFYSLTGYDLVLR